METSTSFLLAADAALTDRLRQGLPSEGSVNGASKLELNLASLRLTYGNAWPNAGQEASSA